jgi:hypothetical protein
MAANLPRRDSVLPIALVSLRQVLSVTAVVRSEGQDQELSMVMGGKLVFHRRDDTYNTRPTMKKSLKRWNQKKSMGPGAELSQRGCLFE